MKCPKCGFEQSDDSTECRQCGVVYEKYLAIQERAEEISMTSTASGFVIEEENEQRDFWQSLSSILFSIKPEMNVFNFAGRIFIFLIIILWGLKFIFTPMETNYTGSSFLHLVNLPFHEAGHIFFRPFGQFMMTLGGSLTQLLIPFICVVVFLLKTRDAFASSVSLWWFGESMMDLAPYINDARQLTLILLGGVTGRDVEDYHDWEFILRKLGWLQYDHFLAHTAYNIGIAIMLCTFLWGGFLLFKQYRNLENHSSQ
jgi:hypothetical protein